MSLTPYLYYEDVAGALAFLAKAFGFRRHGPVMRRPDGKLNHAAMKFGGDFIMMGCPAGKYRNPRRLGQATQCLYIPVPNADRQFARARKAGAKILEEPKDTPYGHRRFGAEDPEGHQWYFCHALKTPAARRRAR